MLLNRIYPSTMAYLIHFFVLSLSAAILNGAQASPVDLDNLQPSQTESNQFVDLFEIAEAKKAISPYLEIITQAKNGTAAVILKPVAPGTKNQGLELINPSHHVNNSFARNPNYPSDMNDEFAYKTSKERPARSVSDRIEQLLIYPQSMLTNAMRLYNRELAADSVRKVGVSDNYFLINTHFALVNSAQVITSTHDWRIMATPDNEVRINTNCLKEEAKLPHTDPEQIRVVCTILFN